MRNILIFCIMLILLGQGLFYSKNIKKLENDNINIKECIDEENNAKNIKEINLDLKTFKDNEIVSYNKSQNKWIINIQSKGNKDDIYKALSTISNEYVINNYNLSYNNKIFTLELEIEGK